MATSATASSKMHFILIGVAVACIVLAGTVYLVARAASGPAVNLSVAAQSEALQRSLAHANYVRDHPFPSNGIKALLKSWESNRTFTARPDGQPLSHNEMLVQLAVNPKYEVQRLQYFNVMEPEDFTELIRTFAYSIDFAADDVVTKDDEQSKLIVKRRTFTAEPMEPVQYPDSPELRNHKYDPEIISKYFEPLGSHKVESIVEVAGFQKNSNKMIFEPWLKYDAYTQVGSDFVGVSKDGTIIALADGVGGAAGSDLASKAVVEMAIELLSYHKASLHTHSWRLLNTVVSFMETCKMTGKTTFVVAQIEKQSMGGAKVTVLNVGDSGVAIVNSEGVAVVRTPIGVHKDNQPFQLKSSVIASSNNAHLYEHDVPAGSRILVFSDGVPDNLWPQFYSTPTRAPEIAAHVAATVHERAGPAKAPIGSRFKQDDVSIVVAKV